MLWIKVIGDPNIDNEIESRGPEVIETSGDSSDESYAIDTSQSARSLLTPLRLIWPCSSEDFA